jgi:hypothetical protein
LYFLPLPQGQGSLRPTFAIAPSLLGAYPTSNPCPASSSRARRWPSGVR